MTQAFRHLDRRGVRAIGAAHALRAVRGEINARRADAINEAFDYLLHDTCSVDLGNTDDEETLEPARVAQLFNAEAHPHVVAGVRKSRDVLSEFLGAFDGEIDYCTSASRELLKSWSTQRERHTMNFTVFCSIDNLASRVLGDLASSEPTALAAAIRYACILLKMLIAIRW